MLHTCIARFDVIENLKKFLFKALFSSPQKQNKNQNSSSYQILRYIHEVLNIDKNKN